VKFGPSSPVIYDRKQPHEQKPGVNSTTHFLVDVAIMFHHGRQSDYCQQKHQTEHRIYHDKSEHLLAQQAVCQREAKQAHKQFDCHKIPRIMSSLS